MIYTQYQVELRRLETGEVQYSTFVLPFISTEKDNPLFRLTTPKEMLITTPVAIWRPKQ